MRESSKIYLRIPKTFQTLELTLESEIFENNSKRIASLTRKDFILLKLCHFTTLKLCKAKIFTLHLFA